MNINSIKKIGFSIFSVFTIITSIIAILGIWEILNEDKAWKGVFTLLVLNIGILFILVIGEKIFSKK